MSVVCYLYVGGAILGRTDTLALVKILILVFLLGEEHLKNSCYTYTGGE